MLCRTIRLGKADVTLNAVIRNTGVNTAYQTSLAITVPNGMSVSYVKLAGDVRCFYGFKFCMGSVRVVLTL